MHIHFIGVLESVLFLSQSIISVFALINHFENHTLVIEMCDTLPDKTQPMLP